MSLSVWGLLFLIVKIEGSHLPHPTRQQRNLEKRKPRRRRNRANLGDYREDNVGILSRVGDRYLQMDGS
ncbi:hypothetical protein POPTR_009G140750v4 [Populus trichocarpa]|uniref:Uncharacterized protein n=1 Tax=Populus trichocarpa TaxID=3694 RepID=A0A3N7H667_POPTR|nr:hypothetical protein BDE02_09G124600 [Populus trichocarpa]RQO95904.1 hypothetical protein POPTR_009G140750v4 [Populus trichocarpa]